MRRGTPSGRTDDRGTAEEWFGAEPARAVASARRRAVRDGDPQTDTAHLLHGLLETDHRVQELLGSGPLVGKLLGYLVQRSIGYGLGWRGTVEGVPESGQGSTGWSPAALAALCRSARSARLRGASKISGVDLFLALIADRESRAVEVLRAAGLGPERLATLATPTPAASTPTAAEVSSYQDDTTVGS